MPAIVPELVNMASDPTVSTTDLLRRALVVARRLAAPELVDWINSELTGYKQEEVPDYRRLNGQLVAENPYNGVMPFFAPPEMTELLTDFSARQSIPELIRLQTNEAGIFSHFPPDVEQTLIRMMRESMGVAMRPALRFSTVQIEGIIETVRSRILDWALDLEGRGIIGEGMTFTQQEKLAVQQIHNHFGDVSGSQIQISSSGSTQTQANTTGANLEALKGLVQALAAVLEPAQGDVADELRSELATLKAQADSPKPKWEIIKATARSIKTIAEGTAGGLIAGLAQPHIATLLALAAA
ncbi:hypothetical protein [Ottowia thiooxydans]|uniref:AbiTii domain-containing protein n=1 Tax=Ottowia thiooxydans TaxID=219182 RepID=A0ABV2Q1S3_9BURK